MSSVGTRRPKEERRGGAPGATKKAPRADAPPRTLRAFWLPSAVAALLAAMSLLPRVQQNVALTRSFLGASLALLALHLVLYLRLGGNTASRTLTLAGPRAQHY